MILTLKNEEFGQKDIPVPFFLPKILHKLRRFKSGRPL